MQLTLLDRTLTLTALMLPMVLGLAWLLVMALLRAQLNLRVHVILATLLSPGHLDVELLVRLLIDLMVLVAILRGALVMV